MSGFENSIINALNALIRAAIHSPNFITGISGWTINKDGSAEFNNLTIRGTFQGINFVINSSGLFMYDPTETIGNLVVSITPKAVTGPLGESVPAGITVGKVANPQVLIAGGNPSFIEFPLNDAGFDIIKPSVFASVGVGIARYASLALQGPTTILGGHIDSVEVVLNSPNADGSSSANYQIYWVDTAGGIHNYFIQDFGGVNIQAAALIRATQPGTGTTVVNPAISEGWHSLGTLAGYTVTVGRYRKLPTNETEIEITVLAGGTNAASVAFSNVLPVGYRPVADTRRPLAGSMTNTVWPNALISASTGSVTVGQNASNGFGIYGYLTIPLD